MQALAPPGGVVVDEATRRLLGQLFELEDLGPRDLKGFETPVRAHAVVAARRAASRFAALRSGASNELVGRDEELEILMRRWRTTTSGSGQLVLVSGEPGIGKSRLAHGVMEALAEVPHARLRYQCSPFHSSTALHPVIERLERSAGFGDDDDDDDARLAKLEALVSGAGRRTADDEAVPLLASLLGVPTDGRYPELALTPRRQKQRVIEVLVAQLARLAERNPVLFVLEDAHWIDPTTQELLDVTIDRLPDLPVLAIVTHRPGFVAPWTGRSHVTLLALNRLDRHESGRLIDEVCGDRAVPDAVREQIVRRTDGVPLFVEEFTRAALESGAADREVEIPATLKDALESRLGRLDVGREVAQIGAVLGRNFDHRLLAAAHDGEAGRLRQALDELVGARLLFVRGTAPDAHYTFKHALVQDTAYDSLLRSARASLHGRVADVLLRDFPRRVEDEPEVVAHHLTEAGRAVEAASFWQRAGDIAARRFAATEAIHQYGRAIELVAGLPPGDEARRQELELQLHLAPVYMAAKAFGAPEAERAYRRATELAHGVGDAGRAFVAQWPVDDGPDVAGRGRIGPHRRRVAADERGERRQRRAAAGVSRRVVDALPARGLRDRGIVRGERHPAVRPRRARSASFPVRRPRPGGLRA